MGALRWHLRATEVAQVVEVSQHRVQNVEEVPGEVKGGQQEPAGLSSAGFCHIVAGGTAMRSSDRACDHMLVQFDLGHMWATASCC